MKNLFAYIDGACQNNHNRGKGGWASVIVSKKGKIVKELSAAEECTTSSRMALTAAIKTLEYFLAHHPKNSLIIKTNSRQIVKGIAAWVVVWEANQWRCPDGKDVPNADLWQRLNELNKEASVAWLWIKPNSHSLNKKVDSIAKDQLRGVYQQRIEHPPGRKRPKSPSEGWLNDVSCEKDQFTEMPFDELLYHCDKITRSFFEQISLPIDLKEVALRWHLRGLSPNKALHRSIQEASQKEAV